MKKKLLGSLLSIAMVAAIVMSVAACGSKKVGTAYGIVHGGYLAVATVELGSKDKIKDATLDEVILPHHWAILGSDVSANYKFSVIGESKFAEYIKIGDKYFKGTLETGAKFPTYVQVDAKGVAVTAGIADLMNELGMAEDASRNDKTGETTDASKTKVEVQKWYYETARDNAYSFQMLSPAADGTLTFNGRNTSLGVNAYGGLLKATNLYWPGVNVETEGKQWNKNADATIDYIKANGIPSGVEIEAHKAKATENKPADLVTGATWVDYPDYMFVFRNAAEAAK